MYNSEKSICRTLSSIQAQIIDDQTVIHIYVVDDCSTDCSRDSVESKNIRNLELIKLPKNLGRSGACNEGSRYGNGEYCLFLDSDCCLSSEKTLSDLVFYLRLGNDYCFGEVRHEENSFLGEYEDQLLERRNNNPNYFMRVTTAFFVCRRALFEGCNGFSEKYHHYGFEDRDLIIRMFKGRDDAHNIYTNNKLTAFHEGSLGLKDIADRMWEAGRYTSSIFYDDHPLEYNKTHYARIDVRFLPKYLIVFVKAVCLIKGGVLKIGCMLLSKQYTPMYLRIKLIQTISAVYYMSGTISANQKIKKHINIVQ